MATEAHDDGRKERQPDDAKVYISRVPAIFTEETVQRLFEETLGNETVVEVSVVFPSDAEAQDESAAPPKNHDSTAGKEATSRGFGFVTLASVELKDKIIDLGTVRGGRKPTSSKKHTLYVREVVREGDDSAQKPLCFLWPKFRCPYGEACKFLHEGEGGSVAAKSGDKSSKKQKCFAFKKGKCKAGDACPYLHDVTSTSIEKLFVAKDKSDKDCISWKTKGKCRKVDTCPYRHDESVRTAALDKKRRRAHGTDHHEAKNKQPLWVRVFGLNYETTENDVKEFFRDCGKVEELSFPVWEDSGRSKGYCGVRFQSPKAVSKAIDLDGSELQGRWLQVQAGRMYLKQWEEREENDGSKRHRGNDPNEETN
jgi:hypothetical protein